MIYKYTDYVVYLKDELESRRRHNPRYSMRAFARDMDFSPSAMSELLNGKFDMSVATSEKIADKLSLAHNDRKYFLDLVQSKVAPTEDLRRVAEIRLQQFRKDLELMQIAEDQFKLIADWYHLAILELMNLKSFKHDYKWIAESLGISDYEAKIALQRLQRLEFIKSDNGRYELLKRRTVAEGHTPSAAIKKFHQQIIEKAAGAIMVQPISQREYISTVLSLDENELEECKKIIRAFRQDFVEKTKQTSKKNSVYALAVQLFKLNEDPTLDTPES